METTGQQIFKRLSGQVANVGSAISGVKHGIEDMKKEAERAQASKQAEMRERALQSGQNEIDAKVEQNTGFQDREAMINNQQAPQVEPQAMEGGKK